MAKIGIFYGSTTGYTADVAQRIAKALNVEMSNVHDVANTAPSALGDYDVLVLGASTWGDGELQGEFADFLDGAEQLYLKGKKLAVFALGDESHGENFAAALEQISGRMMKTEVEQIAPFNVDGYDVPASQRPGLAIDEVNHADLTDARVAAWASEIASSL